MGRKTIVGIAALLVAGALVTVALATPAIGVITATVLARGTLTSAVNANADGVVLRTNHATDHVVQELVFAGGSSSGWHRHPGVVLVTIKSGTVVHYTADCKPETLTAGQTFWESGTHATLLRNETHSDAVVYASYIVPMGAALRIDMPNPGCTVA